MTADRADKGRQEGRGDRGGRRTEAGDEETDRGEVR